VVPSFLTPVPDEMNQKDENKTIYPAAKQLEYKRSIFKMSRTTQFSPGQKTTGS